MPSDGVMPTVWTRDEVFAGVRDVLVDALGVEDAEVKLEASIVDDLGAESIDFLDIVLIFTKRFSIQVTAGEMFPTLPEQYHAVGRERVWDRRAYVEDGGVINAEGVKSLQTYPMLDVSAFGDPPNVKNWGRVMTVNYLVNYVCVKLGVE